jgi:spore germination protein GerM
MARKPVKDTFPPMPPIMPPSMPPVMPPHMRAPKKPGGFLFWTLFFVVIFSLFFVSAPRIRTTLENTGLLDHLSQKNETVNPGASPVAPPVQPAGSPAAGNPVVEAPVVEKPTSEEPVSPALPAEEPLAGVPPEVSPAPAAPTTTPAAQPVKSPPAGASRERTFYFIRVDGDGAILRTPVTRPVAASASPLVDTLHLLLQGPTAEEKRRGLISLIPQGVEFLRAEVRGSTAYISFSEKFMFNDYGVEGYVGQLREVIWTVTEFPNITDVQILIEGRIVEYLGERIKIGSPLGRNSF